MVCADTTCSDSGVHMYLVMYLVMYFLLVVRAEGITSAGGIALDSMYQLSWVWTDIFLFFFIEGKRRIITVSFPIYLDRKYGTTGNWRKSQRVVADRQVSSWTVLHSYPHQTSPRFKPTTTLHMIPLKFRVSRYNRRMLSGLCSIRVLEAGGSYIQQYMCFL